MPRINQLYLLFVNFTNGCQPSTLEVRRLHNNSAIILLRLLTTRLPIHFKETVIGISTVFQLTWLGLIPLSTNRDVIEEKYSTFSFIHSTKGPTCFYLNFHLLILSEYFEKQSTPIIRSCLVIRHIFFDDFFCFVTANINLFFYNSLKGRLLSKLKEIVTDVYYTTANKLPINHDYKQHTVLN